MYPTLEEVEKASHEQICKWYRFLPGPGSSAAGQGDYKAFKKVLGKEAPIMDRIHARLKELGGFTPEISKKIGW